MICLHGYLLFQHLNLFRTAAAKCFHGVALKNSLCICLYVCLDAFPLRTSDSFLHCTFYIVHHDILDVTGIVMQCWSPPVNTTKASLFLGNPREPTKFAHGIHTFNETWLSEQSLSESIDGSHVTEQWVPGQPLSWNYNIAMCTSPAEVKEQRLRKQELEHRIKITKPEAGYRKCGFSNQKWRVWFFSWAIHRLVYMKSGTSGHI